MIQTYSKSKYDKIRELKKCLENINEDLDYNFSIQINNDHIQLMLQQLDCEILFSGEKAKDLKNSFKEFYNNKTFQDALSKACLKNLSNKNRLYLWLLDKHLYSLLLIVRKLKKV